MSQAQNMDLVHIVFDGCNAHDVARAARLCADDFLLEDIPAGLTLRGPEGMRRWVQTWLDGAPDAHAALERIFFTGQFPGGPLVRWVIRDPRSLAV